jgi:signal transduction histidine kinase
MAVSAWLRPPRRVLSLLIGVTVLLGATLAWLGWRLLEQDRALEAQRLRGRLEDAADRVAAQLRHNLDATRDTLARLASLPEAEFRAQAARVAAALDDDAALVVLTPSAADVRSQGRLPYLPSVPTAVEPPPQTFARAESLEFRARDYGRASTALRALAAAPDPATRAGALLRLGRTLRKAGHLDTALAAYDALAALGAASVEGFPAELLGRYARLGLLEEARRGEALRREADSLYADLLRGRWPIARATHEFYADAVRRRMDADRAARLDSAHAPALALAAGAAALWELRRAADQTDSTGGDRTVRAGDRAVFVLWRGSSARAIGLVAGPAHVEHAWLGDLAPQLEREGVRVALADAEGNTLLAQITGSQRPQALRTAEETRLPWTLRVASADPAAAFAQLAGRRRLVLLGLGVAALIILLGLYAVTRAVSREMEVARLKSDFVAAVSHEFRTPLTTMRQLTEMLAGGRVASDERRATYYETIKRESERLQRLVEGLLDFGRMEAGALEFRPEPLDATRLVTELVGEFRSEVAGRGYEVALRAENGACTVRADREALCRAVWNLLDNAVKYSPDHRTVLVTVASEENRVAIRVKDHGVGIPASERERMFEKFVRGSASDVRAVKGTGIGLAMVRHIVNGHHGEIRVESEPGEGSTFTILLPVEAGA